MDRPAELDAAVASDLARWRAAGLERELPCLPLAGADFTSNDVLGLSRDPSVLDGARDALERFGAGGRASRLLGGGSPLDAKLEEAVAAWLGAASALMFPSGYHANLGAIGALVGPGDVVVSDELNHASLVDAARLARARVLVFRHADAEHAEQRLAEARGVGGARRILLATESVFSMDGDTAPLAALADACGQHGARLLIDEAHAMGVLGTHGAGGWAATGREDAQVVRIVTGGKALGVGGALVVSSAAVRTLLINRARTFAFTTAAPPAVAGALNAAVRACRAADEQRDRATGLARRIASELGLAPPPAAILPVVIGSPEAALEAAEALRRRDLHVRAVRPPTVPEDSSRLRIVCHAFNTDEEVERLIAGLREVLPSTQGRSTPATSRGVSLFVAGTDTGIGKTVVSALLVRAARRADMPVDYWKPVQTGDDDDTAEVAQLADHAAATPPGCSFALPASPHEAAAAEGVEVDPRHLDETLTRLLAERPDGLLICELAGGLHVPLTETFRQIDWLARMRPPLVIVARAGLGTLNHTLLSVEALRARHLEPRALFLVGELHAANLEYLRAHAGVETVFAVPHFKTLDGAALDRWLDEHDLAGVVST